MEGFLGENAISKNEGKAFITRNKQNFVLARVTKLEASLSFEKKEVKVIGNRMTGHKITGISGSGTLALLEVTSDFKKMGIDYIRTGILPYFNVQSEAEDPSTPFGREVIVYVGCLLDEIAMTSLASDGDLLEAEYPFTYDGVELLSEYTKRVQGEI